MEFIGKNTHIEFMRLRKITAGISLAIIIVALASMFLRGLNLGIDFTGGTLLEVGYEEAVDLTNVRQTLADAGYDDTTVQHFGTSKDVMIRVAPREGLSSAQLTEELMVALKAADASVEMRRQEFVGPQVGEELTNDGGLAMIYALLGILVYVALRFEYRFAVGAVAALIHDVVITIGAFALFQLPFDLTVLAAVLAVIGYSLNDTIVVFDRIRENFRVIRKADSDEVIDTSINQTLSRTLITSGTTLLVLLALFIWGGEMIHGFATALLIGVGVGTYSSIFIASPTLLALGITREDLMPVKKEGEGEELDELP